jgi:hypothetical protein
LYATGIAMSIKCLLPFLSRDCRCSSCINERRKNDKVS